MFWGETLQVLSNFTKRLVKLRDHELSEQPRLLPAKPNHRQRICIWKKIHKINALFHQLLEAGGSTGGQLRPCQQGVLLLELCELEVFLPSSSWQLHSSSPGSSPEKYSSCHSRGCPSHCIEKSSLYSGNHKTLKIILEFLMASTKKNIYWHTKKNSLFYPKDSFHPKKSMVSRRNQTLSHVYLLKSVDKSSMLPNCGEICFFFSCL